MVIKHGNASKHNLLVHGGNFTNIDFENALQVAILGRGTLIITKLALGHIHEGGSIAESA